MSERPTLSSSRCSTTTCYVFDACAGPSVPPSWEVDAHLVRVTARPGSPGLPSPEGRHLDGFDVSPLGQGPRQGPGHRDMLMMSFAARRQ
ncbi:2OG-Fe dioxygenase family protein [Streptomyces sp. NPDC004788]